MRNRGMQWASVLFGVALVSGLLVVTANAHIGVSHSPIETDLPDLVSVEVASDDEGPETFICATDQRGQRDCGHKVY